MRYQVRYKGDASGVFTEFTEPDNTSALRYARRAGYGKPISSLEEMVNFHPVRALALDDDESEFAQAVEEADACALPSGHGGPCR